MRKKNFKGRCEKRTVGKCEDVCKTFDPIQYAYANVLQASSKVKSFCCNVPLDEEDIVPKDDIVPQNDISVAEYTLDFEECDEDTLEAFPDVNDLDLQSRKLAHKHFTYIAGVLPFLTDKKRRCEAIRQITEEQRISKQTVCNYLWLYLVSHTDV